jgi:hypothetical protein
MVGRLEGASGGWKEQSGMTSTWERGMDLSNGGMVMAYVQVHDAKRMDGPITDLLNRSEDCRGARKIEMEASTPY